MVDFRRSSDKSTEAANKVITSLGSTLQTEKAVLSKVHTEIQVDNAELQTSITTQLDKLQEDLAIENLLIDKHAV